MIASQISPVTPAIEPIRPRSTAAAAGGDQPGTASAPTATSTAVAADLHAAAVERGRIASMAGITALIWLAILVLMVWGASS